MDVNFEGTIHQFPDDFTDDDIKKALSALPKSPALVKPASTEEIDPLPINPTTGKPMAFTPQFPVIGYTGEPRASTFVDEAVIPTLSTLLGGTVAGPRAVKLGAEALTAGGGEAINQLYGITKPSLKSILAAAATPIGGRALYGAGKGALTAISKQVAGKPVIAETVSEGFRKRLLPGISSEEIFNAVEPKLASAGNITPKVTQDTLEDIFLREGTRPRLPTKKAIVKSLDPIYKNIIGQGSSLKPTDLFNTSLRLRKEATAAFKDGNVELGRNLSEARSAILQDLANNGFPEAKQALGLYRKEVQVEKLASLLGKPEALTKFREQLRTDKLFNKTFSDIEKEEIERVMRRMGSLTPSGMGGVVGTGVTGYAGYKIGGRGGLVGLIAAREAAAALLASKPGRVFLSGLMHSKPGLDAPKIAAMMQFARAYLDENLIAPPLES